MNKAVKKAECNRGFIARQLFKQVELTLIDFHIKISVIFLTQEDDAIPKKKRSSRQKVIEYIIMLLLLLKQEELISNLFPLQIFCDPNRLRIKSLPTNQSSMRNVPGELIVHLIFKAE